MFLNYKVHFLIVGASGTGKTLNIKNLINQNYSNEVFANLITGFSG